MPEINYSESARDGSLKLAWDQVAKTIVECSWKAIYAKSDAEFDTAVREIAVLSRFSRVQLGAIPQTAAHQAPPSPGFSRQEHWSGLPFPSPMHESEK